MLSLHDQRMALDGFASLISKLPVLHVLAILCFGCIPSAQARTGGECSAFLSQMRIHHVPDVAIGWFARGVTHFDYCTTEKRQLSPNAIFEAASLSKPVFAAAVLTLVDDGKLDLDKPLITYLGHPYEHQQNPFAPRGSDVVTDPRLSSVTARMVLSHTTGLPNWARNGRLQFVWNPGERWGYSGEAYVFLQTVSQAITHEPIDRFVRERVFAPLQMTHSSFVWLTEYEARMLSKHRRDGTAEPAGHYDHAVASTTFYTTLDDYAKFVSALLHAKPGSIFAMEEQKQVEVRPDLELAWGLGLGIEETDQPSFFHWGSNPGFQSFFFVHPASGLGVLFLTDSDNGLMLVDLAVNRFVPGSHPVLKFPMLHPTD